MRPSSPPPGGQTSWTRSSPSRAAAHTLRSSQKAPFSKEEAHLATVAVVLSLAASSVRSSRGENPKQIRLKRSGKLLLLLLLTLGKVETLGVDRLEGNSWKKFRFWK